jgi:hypothetical protein
MQAGGGAGGGGGEGGAEAAPRIHVREPVSGRAAKIWLALQTPIAMPFAEETPLEDVIKHIKSSTASKDLPDGLPVYIHPIGLQEAEKTVTSPVRFAVEGVPLATSLKLMLEQLELTYRVHPDGFVIIDAQESPRSQAVDPTLQILDELRALRSEVKQLRTQVSMLRGLPIQGGAGSPGAAGAMGGMGGGMSGFR